MDLKKEWKEIKGYEGRYIISNYGEIISLPRYKQNNSKLQYVEPKEIARYVNSKNGYVYVQLWNNATYKNIRLHKLVAQNFIPNKDNKLQINHIDGNKQNNRVDNLEWANDKEQMKHCKEKLGWNPHHTTNRKRRKVMRSDGKTYNSIKEAGKENNLFPSNIVMCCQGKCESIGGYKWEYV